MALALFVVRYGCCKCFKIAEDGYERIVRITVSHGDVIGCEGLANSGCQTKAIVAAVASVARLAFGRPLVACGS